MSPLQFDTRETTEQEMITFNLQPPEDDHHRYLGSYDREYCNDCRQSSCPQADACIRYDGSPCLCVSQGLHASHSLETSSACLDDTLFELFDFTSQPLGIDIPSHGNQHPYSAPMGSPVPEYMGQISTSGPSSDGSPFISTPPSPNPGQEGWSHIPTYMNFRGRSNSSAHGDEVSIGPESQVSGSPHELFAAGSSYGSQSPHLPDFSGLSIDPNARSYEESLPSPAHLSPISHMSRSNSFNAGQGNGPRRHHARSVSHGQQFAEDGELFGRGRGVSRARSASSPGSRRHSPYTLQRQTPDNGPEAGPSTSPYQTAGSSESLENAEVVKEVVLTPKTKEAAERRRKHPAIWNCLLSNCDATFTTKFKRDRHVHAHAGHKPFMCGFKGCGKTFSSQSDTVRHEKTSRMHEHDREQEQGLKLELDHLL